MAELGPIALNEALRRVAEQNSTLASIRSAAGTILSASTIGSAFLAGIALDGATSVGALAWVAIVATAATAFLAVVPLMLMSLGVATSPEILDRGEWKAHTDDAAALYLAKFIWERTQHASARLDRKWLWVMAAGITTTVSIVLWIAAIATATPGGTP